MLGPRPLHRRERIAFLVLVVLFVMLLVDAGLRLRDARSEMREAILLLDRSHARLGPLLRFDTSVWPGRGGYGQLQRDLREAERHLKRADKRLGYLQRLAVLGWVIPRYGETIRNGPALLDFTTTVTSAASGVLEEAGPLFVGQGNSSDRARAVFVGRHAALDAHLGELEDVRKDAERLSTVRWAGPARRAATLLPELNEDLSKVTSVRATATKMAAGLDLLLGYEGPRTYIVLGQNEQEIRPTGGYLGTMGVVRLVDGKILTFEYSAAYEYDPKPPKFRVPPTDLANGLGLRFFYVRDANWSPWFPESAALVQHFLWEDRSLTSDGVVAVDTEMLRLLLGALGSMTVQGVDVPLTAENFYAVLEDEIFAEEVDSTRQKRTILGRVLQQSIDRLQAADADQVPVLVGALRQGVAARHLQLFGNDRRVQAIFEGFGADGTMRPRQGYDFVAVVDANVSYSKVGAAISRETTYLRRTDGRVDVFISWRNDLTQFAGIRYKRLGEVSTIYNPLDHTYTKAKGVYLNQFRIFLPHGSTVEDVAGFAPIFRIEQGMLTLGGRIQVLDGEQTTVVVTYLPAGSPAGVDIWKQGGQQRDRLRVVSTNGRQQENLFDGPFIRDTSVSFSPAHRDGSGQ